MKVLDLLDELDEIIEVASPVPVLKKVMVDPNEVGDIVKEIRLELPDEIQQAQWIKNERQRILDEAKVEYQNIINEAQERAERLVEQDEITVRAKARAEDIIKNAKENSRMMKMSILDYSDGMLYNLQEKVDEMHAVFFEDMYNSLQETFERVYNNIDASRDEVKEQIYKCQQDQDK